MSSLHIPKSGLTSNTFIVLVAVFLTAFGNSAFISNVLKVYPVAGSNVFALLSLLIVFCGATILLFGVLCYGRSTKPVLIVFLLLSSLAAYFMDSFGIIIDDDMLQNAVQTNAAEAGDLFNLRLLAYLALLGIGPAIALSRVPLRRRGLRIESIARLKLLGSLLLVMAGLILVFGSFYASFIREHKALRAYANPTYYTYSTIKYVNRLFASNLREALAPIGLDAIIPSWDAHRELIVLVVGETARADHFSLNGYERETNPKLSKANVISFTNFWSCGTSTAVSVPCIFSLGGEDMAGTHESATSENLLDVLQHSDVNVLWLENNSDSKGVAIRATVQDFRSSNVNPVCDSECRDESMLTAVQPYIDSHPEGDIFIVLHQMGSHGPAYYLRYPPEFEKFTPVCKTNDLSRCSREEIVNAYDNTILYTDHFLARTIALLKKNSRKFETALFYVGDHGESLGEDGLYLHGYPKFLAPDAQLHVPALMWFGSSFDDMNVSALREKRVTRFTHDNVFHTLLGMMEIETSIYRPEMDILESVMSNDEEKLARP